MPERAENNHANSQSQVRLWFHHTVCTQLPNKYEFRKAFKNLNHRTVLHTNQLAAEVKVHGKAGADVEEVSSPIKATDH